MAKGGTDALDAWWRGWWAQDWSWAGLVDKPVGRNGDTGHGGLEGERTLQDYWRRDPVSGAVRDDAAMEAAGELIRAPDGELWHLMHVPLTWASGSPAKIGWDASQLDRLSNLVVARLTAAAQTDCDGLSNALAPDGRAQFSGAVLLVTPRHTGHPNLVCDDAWLPRWDAREMTIGPGFSCKRAHFPDGARFDNVNLRGDASFDRTTFSGDASFTGATFSGDARFDNATFLGGAGFDRVTFLGVAGFHRATFSGDAGFDSATFSGGAAFGSATFSGSAKFKGATFSRIVGFFRTTFSGDASFLGATFPEFAVFRLVSFSGHAEFSRATFSGDAEFDFAKFSGAADFVLATFSGRASFFGAQWHLRVGFQAANFLGDAKFQDATFSGRTNFERATFSGGARFDGAQWHRGVDFGSATFAGPARFADARFPGFVSFADVDFAKAVTFESAQFGTDTPLPDQPAGALFHRCQFAGPARFHGARFAAFLDFTAATFMRQAWFTEITWPRDAAHWHAAFDQAVFRDVASFAGSGFRAFAAFDGATFAGGLQFDDTDEPTADLQFRAELSQAMGGALPSAEADEAALKQLERGCRVLKQAMEKASHKTREQIFFAFELTSRRHQASTPPWERLFSLAYQWFAEYGRSTARPLGSLFATIPAFAGPYWLLSGLGTWPAFWQAMNYSLSRVLPFGAWAVKDSPFEAALLGDADTLFTILVRLLATAQSVMAVILVFLSLLAIRRRFQIT